MNLLLAGVLALTANADCKECKTFSAKVNSVGITVRNKDGRFKGFRNKLRRGR